MTKKDLTPKQVYEIAKKTQTNPPCPKCGVRNGHKFGCPNYAKTK